MASRIYKYKITRLSNHRRGKPIGNSYHFFVNSLDILKDLNNIFSQYLKQHNDTLSIEYKNQLNGLDKKGKKEWAKYLKLSENATKESFKAGTIHITNKKLVDVIDGQLKLFQHSNRFNMLIKEMSLVYLVTEFEQFLGRAISIIFEKFPNYLMAVDKNMSYREILSCKKIDNLKEKIIEQEVNVVISRKIDDVSKFLKNTFCFDIKTFPNYKKFKERFYRRHIVIHNNCYPNEKYRKGTNYKGVNTRLYVTQKYLITSINLFRSFATNIKNSFERKTNILIG